MNADKGRTDDFSPEEFRKWIAAATANGTDRLSQGYQGHTYLYEKDGQRWVVKAPLGWGPGRWIRRRMLRHEYRAYSTLGHADGVPMCYGFIDGSYLVLEYIDGEPIRQATITDPEGFYKALFSCLRGLHTKGVAHGDLKKKDNILVVDGLYPVLIDFGVAIIRKAGRAPVNHYLYRLFQRFDYNAWVKHKYKRRMDQISEEDRRYYHRTGIEYIAKWIKRRYINIKRRVRSFIFPNKK